MIRSKNQSQYWKCDCCDRTTVHRIVASESCAGGLTRLRKCTCCGSEIATSEIRIETFSAAVAMAQVFNNQLKQTENSLARRVSELDQLQEMSKEHQQMVDLLKTIDSAQKDVAGATSKLQGITRHYP